MQDLRISFIQSDLVWKDSSANLKVFTEKINKLVEPTNLIVLPEMFNTGFVVDPETIEEHIAKVSLEWMQNQAAEKQLVICGSMIVKEEHQYFNRFYWVLPNGSFESYNKRHLFSLGGEDKHFSPGHENVIIHYKGWKIKPLICYDLRFPVWAKNTYDKGGYEYDVLIYVANWPVARVHAWKSLLVARAIENQCYVVGVNRIGKDGRGTAHSGFSGVVEPMGQWISEEVENVESVQTIKISKSTLESYRQKFNFAQDWDLFSIRG